MNDLAKERKALVSKIGEYKVRRERRRKRGFKGEDLVAKNAMLRYGRRMKKIDESMEVILRLEKAIIEYIGVSPKVNAKTTLGGKARRLYYKWGIEHGINGMYLRKYVSDPRPESPSQIRRRFNRSFENNPGNLELWHRFKQYIEDPSNQLG